ncbi:MAG TPA: MgtC/SapB family protein [Aggregatilineaceae bacterium]|nr:MgtC/SapB family protein [Aggregatilineaceae bacterium]
MSVQAQFEALVPIAVALVLSSVIGLDREWRRSAAGIRTHMLVGMGAALVMVMGRELYGEDGSSRLAQNVITGIGFLGAGVILRNEHTVHQLTTAASIWLVAMIGLAAGAELYVLAGGTTLMGWFVLTVLRLITKRHTLPAEND